MPRWLDWALVMTLGPIGLFAAFVIIMRFIVGPIINTVAGLF